MTRPTFLIIGAMKCGTTSLWRYLQAHPQVCTSETKELDFFSHQWDQGWSWYESQFAHAADTSGVLAIGEASPSYAELHRYPAPPERIASHLPNVRLVYLVRDPIARVLSHYLHNLDRGFEQQPLANAVWATDAYTGISRYATHVDAYLERFRREQLLVVRSEALRDDRRPTLDRVAAFLGIDARWQDIDIQHEQAPTLARRMRRERYRHGLVAGVRAIPTQQRHHRMANMSESLRAELGDLFRPEVERLRPYLEPGFDGWGIA